jgi:hypothetical protein
LRVAANTSVASSPDPNSESRHRSGSLGRGIFQFAVTWAIFFGVYLLLTQDCSVPELLAGAAAAGLAAALLEGLALINARQFRFRASWFGRVLGQLPAAVLRDCVRLIRFLGTYLVTGRSERLGAGRIVSRPFDPEREERAGEARAREALVVLGICLPPNSFAIMVEDPPGRVLVHELVPSAQDRTRGHQDPEWPF